MKIRVIQTVVRHALDLVLEDVQVNVRLNAMENVKILAWDVSYHALLVRQSALRHAQQHAVHHVL